MARAKRKLPAKPAGFVFPQHRDHFCPVIRFPNTKTPPPSTIHTPQKSRPGQTSSTGIRTQKLRCRSERRRPVLFFRITAVTPAAVIRFPNTKPPPPTTIHTPQKPHGPVKRHRPTPEHKKTRCRSEHRRPLSFLRSTAVTSAAVNRLPSAKNPLPLRTPPAGFISPQHRSHFCRRHPIPEHKAPAADDNTHPTKTSRPGQTAPTDTRTQKKPAAAPNTAGRFCFFAPPQSLLLPSSDTRTQSPRRRQYTPHKNLTARSNGTDRRPNTKNPLPLRTPPAVSAFSKKTAALPKCHSSAPTTAGRRTTPPHTI